MIDFDKLHASIKKDWESKSLRILELDQEDGFPNEFVVVAFSSLSEFHEFTKPITTTNKSVNTNFPRICRDMIWISFADGDYATALDGSVSGIDELVGDYYLAVLLDYEINVECPRLSQKMAVTPKVDKPKNENTGILFIP